MIIKNFEQLATTPLRRKALEIIEAGYQAIQTENVIATHLSLQNETLTIKEHTYDLQKYENVYVIAYGKSSYAAAHALHNLLGERITKGIAIGVTGGDQVGAIQTIAGTHPAPSETNVTATAQIMELLKQATEKDLILTVISGGGSSLLSAPHGMSVETKARITTDLMEAGANIHELNYVRKHLSDIKGGRFAALAHPAKVVTLIFSDVPGNDLATIASGATVLDPSTVEDAQNIIQKYDTLARLNLQTIEFSESPKDPKLFEHVDNILLLDPASAVEAMQHTAEQLGLQPRVLSTTLEGDAPEVGAMLLTEAKPGEALLASGETTVTVKGDGIGGRNQELVLANLENIKEGQVVISAGSDGHDHSDAAGAIGDHASLESAKSQGIDPQTYMQTSDSFNFFQKTGDFLDTGLLDSNIADMMVVIYETNS